ncbi:MAG: hypothetical protein R3E73_09245 [Porticoccaceae bacterium]
MAVNGILQSATLSSYAVATPLDLDELKREHIWAMSKAHRLEQEVAVLQQENDQLKAELAIWVAKDKDLKAKRSKAGKANKGEQKPISLNWLAENYLTLFSVFCHI